MNKLSLFLTLALAAPAALAADEPVQEWKSIGYSKMVEDLYATLSDGATANHVYWVETEESISTPGLYRLKNPYFGAPEDAGFTHSASWGDDRYLVIHAEDPDKVYFEEFDTGLECAAFGGAVKIVNRAGFEVGNGRMTLDEAAEAGYTGKHLPDGAYGIHARWIKFLPETADGQPVVYASTPQGALPINIAGSYDLTSAVKLADLDKAGFAIQLPAENGWVDVITAETLGLEKGKSYSVIQEFCAENNPAVTSPARYGFKLNNKTVEESVDALTFSVTDDGALVMPNYNLELVTTRRGGNMRRITIYYNDASEGSGSVRYRDVTFNKDNSYILGSTSYDLPKNGYPSHYVSLKSDETNDVNMLFKTGGTKKMVIDRIEIEWGFDESPWYTPKCDNLVDGQNINVLTKMQLRDGARYGMTGNGNEVWYQINDDEAQPYDAANPPTLPWGRDVVKIFSRRHRRPDSEPLVLHLNVFSMPVNYVTDVIDLTQAESGSSHVKTGYPSGAEYLVKGWSYDGYVSCYSQEQGICATKSGGALKAARFYHCYENPDGYKIGAISLYKKKEGDFTSWPSSFYSGVTFIDKISPDQAKADATAGTFSELQVVPSDVTSVCFNLQMYQGGRFSKIEFDWYTALQPCEKPMLSKYEGRIYATEPIALDCLTDGAVYHAAINGADPIEVDPEVGLLLPVGKKIKVELYTTAEGAEPSEKVTAVYDVVPATVATLSEFVGLGEQQLPVEIESPLTVVYRNTDEIYLSDATLTVRAKAADASSLAALRPGHKLEGVKVLAVEGSADLAVAVLPEDATEGAAPVYAVIPAAEVAAQTLFSTIRVEHVGVAASSEPNTYILTSGETAVPVVNRYADPAVWESTVAIDAQEGRLYNMEGLTSADGFIPVRVREICATPVISPDEGMDLEEGVMLELDCRDEDASIYFSLNEGDETLYTVPLALSLGQVKVTARAEHPDMDPSDAVTAIYNVVAGIGSIEADMTDTSVQIFDLQGRRVNGPCLPGLYIVKTGSNVILRHIR